MRSIAIIIFLISTAFSCQQDPFVGLNQLTGDWRIQASRGVMYESWKNLSAGEMQGRSYKLNGKDTIVFENVRLAKLSEGIFYIPVVSNENDGKPVPFRLISSADKKYVFENKEHDFPQQIVYYFKDGKHIDATISGPTENGPKSIVYHFEEKLWKRFLLLQDTLLCKHRYIL